MHTTANMKSAIVHLLLVYVLFCITISVQSAEKGDKNDSQPHKDIRPQDIVIVVITQKNSYHLKRAEAFRKHFNDQVKDLPKSSIPQLLLTHESWDIPGAWTVLAILPELAKEFRSYSWLLVCEEETRIDLKKLLTVLQRYNHEKEYFLGKALRDSSPTIIHHFAFVDNPRQFAYPDLGAGVLLSQPLFTRVGREWEEDKDTSAGFAIDPKHELAKFIYQDGKGVPLTEVEELCTYNINNKCVTTLPLRFPDCGKEVAKGDLFVGVKTCEKFHNDRAVFVKKTWGKDAAHIEYYSEKDDPSIPTVTLGVPNTERGHCGKTMAMLSRWHDNPDISQHSWYLIADDDTIINLRRLRKLLACYDPREPVHLGEVYGYQVSKNNWGYTYITGGGGMIFSKEAIRRIVAEGMVYCSSDDSPDDMSLGMRFKRMGIPLVHSPYFHQARPDDYSEEFLKARTALSFHKHWNNDPLSVYKYLMKNNDGLSTEESSKSHSQIHEDL